MIGIQVPMCCSNILTSNYKINSVEAGETIAGDGCIVHMCQNVCVKNSTPKGLITIYGSSDQYEGGLWICACG